MEAGVLVGDPVLAVRATEKVFKSASLFNYYSLIYEGVDVS